MNENNLKSIIKELVEESLIEEANSSVTNIAISIIKDVYTPENKKLNLNRSAIAKYINMYNDPMYIPKLVKIGEKFVDNLIADNKDVVDEELGNNILTALGGIAVFVDVVSQEKIKIKSIIESLKESQSK